jgi:peroxiredoxin
MTTLSRSAALIGAPAPDFDLPSTTGHTRLSDLQGRPVVVFFMREFACPMCQGQVRTIQQMAARTPGVHFLIVGGGSVSAAQALARRLKTALPVLADQDRSVYARYDLGRALGLWQRSGTAVIDAHGVLRGLIGSYNPQSAFLERSVTALLGQA